MNEIEEKLKSYFEFLEKQEKPNIDESINKFKEIFENEYIETYSSIDQAYFQQTNQSYYLKNSNGITLEIIGGAWDRYGDRYSHKGRDVWISSKLAEDERYRNGKRIFWEDEYENEKITPYIKEFFKIDLSVESLMRNNDNNVYKTISNEVKDNIEIIKARYNQLKSEAEYQNRDEREYENISPYGGLDVTVHPVSELLYEKLNEYSEDKYFFGKAMAIFNKDFNEYIKNEIEECKYALYIIEHQDEYRRLAELEAETYYIYNPEYDTDEILKNKASIEQQLNEAKKEYEILSNKKYSLFENILGKNKMDLQRKLELYNPKEKDGIINYLEEQLVDINTEEKLYNEYLKDNKEIEDEKAEIKSKLQKPFRNFTLNEDLFDYPFDNGEFFDLISLRRLVDSKENYSNALEQLEKNLSLAEENVEFIEEQEEEDEDMEME